MSNSRKGFVSIIVFILVVAIALAALPIITQHKSFHSISDSAKALYVAEAGVAYYTKHELDNDDDWSNNITEITKSFGSGEFTVAPLATAHDVVKLRSTGSIALADTSFPRTVEYSIRRITPFDFSLYGGESGTGDATFTFVNNGSFDGDIYVKGGLDLTNAVDFTISGEVFENQTETDIPDVDWGYWQFNADHIISGDHIFNGSSYSGIYYVDGNVTLDYNNMIFNGTIVATGNISFTQSNSISINPSPGYPALIAGGDISVAQGNNLSIAGAVYAAGSITIDQGNNIAFDGAIVFGDQLYADHANNISSTLNSPVEVGFSYTWWQCKAGGFKEI
ncbi:MAG: hypothetical protein JSW17_01110 [Candidatus Omnitrophota bacterium]|nr:MAG: hypothetical protein JSW17_01110 [Candidatus Omnitrophota bacterium]